MNGPRIPGQVITVYDFIYEKFRKGIPKMVHSFQKKRAVSSAHGIICISESTKKDLLEFYPQIPANRIHVIYLGVSEHYVPLDDITKRQLPTIASAPFVLFVGSRASYKNFQVAIETLAALPAYTLVTVGGGPLTSAEIASSQRFLSGRHVHIPQLDSCQLNALYNQAHALLYPSSYEGFGIPIIEAMSAGCPTVASNVSAIPEASGDAGLLVDEVRPEAFAARLQELESISFRQAAISKGYIQARRFSWETCYLQTISFYERVWREANTTSE